MNTLSTDLLKELECPVCHTYLRPPIYQCNSGHCICGPCKNGETNRPRYNYVSSKPIRQSIMQTTRHGVSYCDGARYIGGPYDTNSHQHQQYCPVCRNGYSNTRCLILEKIIQNLILPCTNKSKGCTETITLEEMRKHMIICRWQVQNCPVGDFANNCKWTGNWSEIAGHLSGKHTNKIIKLATTTVTLAKNELLFFFAFDNIFLYNQTKEENKSHCVMLMLGPEQEASKYKCVFTMKADNRVDCISETRGVRSIADTIDGICEPCRCFVVDDNIRANVIKNDKLTVNLSPVD